MANEQVLDVASDFKNHAVADNYDPLKSNPLLAKAMNGLTNKTTSSQDTGRSLGWADSIVKSWPSIALTIGVIIIFIYLLKKGRNGSDGILTQNGKFKWYVLAGLSFVFLRGLLDAYIGITTDNALNLLFGLFGIGCVIVPLSSPKYIARLLLIVGLWMLGRGILNIMLFIIATDDVGEFIVTMPISALPNIAVSYALPIVIGAYFLRLHKDRKRAGF